MSPDEHLEMDYEDRCAAFDDAFLPDDYFGEDDEDTIPCSWCGKPVYDDDDNHHVHSDKVMCDDQ